MKGRIERYFVSQVPIVFEFLTWTEMLQDCEKLTAEVFAKATQSTCLDPARLQHLNDSFWAFLNTLRATRRLFLRTATLYKAWRAGAA